MRRGVCNGDNDNSREAKMCETKRWCHQAIEQSIQTYRAK